MRKLNRLWIFSLLVAVVSASAVQAQETAKAGRQKVIDFEESLIEGMGKRPLDSYQQDSGSGEETEGRRLYRIRKSFRMEVKRTLQGRRGLK